MTTTRRADTLTPADNGATIEGVDVLSGDTFSGVMTRGDYDVDKQLVFVVIKRFPYALRPDDLVHVTGAVVAHVPHAVGNIILGKETA